MENILVIVVVTGAVLYLIRRGKKAIQADDAGCDSGDCGSCCNTRSKTQKEKCR